MDMDTVRAVARTDAHAIVVSPRADGSMQASLVTAGVMDHPIGGQPVVAFVVRGATVKLRLWRRDNKATVIFRSGGRWVTVEGEADLIGPDDRFEGFDPAGVPQLLRDVFVAAGGTHDNWAEYDRVMAEDRRCAVFVRPSRIYGRS